MNLFLWEAVKECIKRRNTMTVEEQMKWCDECLLDLDCADLEEVGEIQFCPECRTELCHIMVETEDVFGCPRCHEEVDRDISIKIRMEE